ncbi:DUF7144 family membrane protein [Saccharopolyspora rosea]|uniref:DUF7144 family membrane protein n=1 Tax=Saccharopolyspora rosea TaxID=524884 RepID=UPI0021D8D593|nr:hypothetical protein [Saccharopolyspora rosea]
MATHPRTGWVGWVYFAGAVLLVGGVVQFINGLSALARSGTTFVAPSGTAIHVSYLGAGLSLLITGVVLAIAGVGVFSGRTWARAAAIGLAVLSVLTNIAFFGVYPLSSAVVIVLDLFVIYALAAHGREVARR